jgi:hypothetical protein
VIYIANEFGKDLSSHHKWSYYASSKSIMEHLLNEHYPSLPLSMNRPSLVAPTRDAANG